MTRNNIALIGFRATGKTLVGRILAQQLGHSFVDMDEQLSAEFGQTIDAWVRAHGWESFRQAESRLLQILARKKDLVVATGGGVILCPYNRRILRENFLVVWLQASPEIILSRLTQDPKTHSNRPALTDLSPAEEIQYLLTERSALYSETAHLSFSTDDASPSDLVTRIMASQTPPFIP